MTPVRHRHDRRDHFVLASRQRELWRHQTAEGRKCVEQSVRDQAVRGYNARGAVARWMHRLRIFDRVERTLIIYRSAQCLFGFRQRDCFYPGHVSSVIDAILG